MGGGGGGGGGGPFEGGRVCPLWVLVRFPVEYDLIALEGGKGRKGEG
jgi:hypothetical protein